MTPNKWITNLLYFIKSKYTFSLCLINVCLLSFYFRTVFVRGVVLHIRSHSSDRTFTEMTSESFISNSSRSTATHATLWTWSSAGALFRHFLFEFVSFTLTKVSRLPGTLVSHTAQERNRGISQSFPYQSSFERLDWGWMRGYTGSIHLTHWLWSAHNRPYLLYMASPEAWGPWGERESLSTRI